MRERRPWLKRMSMHLIEGRMLRRAAAVHFTSDQEALEAAELGISMETAVIPLGVEMPHAPPHQDDCGRSGLARGAENCILFLSRLDPKKNVEGLLDAIAMLQPGNPRLRLLIAGDGAPAYVASLKARAKRAGVDKCVEWAGHLEGSAKAAAFARAKIFVLPSFSENFGIAAAEALAQGLPCVLAEGVAIAADVRDARAGIVVAPEAAAIAEGLRRIVADPAEMARMSQRAKQLANDRFSTAAMGAALKELYTDILSRR